MSWVKVKFTCNSGSPRVKVEFMPQPFSYLGDVTAFRDHLRELGANARFNPNCREPWSGDELFIEAFFERRGTDSALGDEGEEKSLAEIKTIVLQAVREWKEQADKVSIEYPSYSQEVAI